MNKFHYQKYKIIDQANTIPLIRLFKLYHLRVDDHYKMICPFKSHKGGRETTASFKFYPETNSFYCYGCGTGHKHAHGCEFMAAMEGISRDKAASKILKLFGDEVDEDKILEMPNTSEMIDIMMDFANTVREFRHTYSDEKSYQFIEKLCWVYDRHNLNHHHNNEALRQIVEQLKNKISSYIP